MPLQNRVDPFSRIHAVCARGAFMGNRGQLHDPETKTLIKQTWTTDGWVICLCAYQGRQRTIMGRGTYTELFFMDEATALAAGHRPCFECQRPRAKAFASGAQKHLRPNETIQASEMNDLILRDIKPHIRKYAPLERKPVNPQRLPDGAMFAIGNTAYLKHKGAALIWSFDGYGEPEPLPQKAKMLTPKFSCAALIGGYIPQIHPSAHG